MNKRNWRRIKQWVCQFLLVCLGFFLLALAGAAAQGSLALPAALGLGVGVLLAMNVLCGYLAPPPATNRAPAYEKRAPTPALQRTAAVQVRRAPRKAPVLAAMHGGRAA